MRCGRRDFAVLVRSRDAALRDRSEVVRVDQVVGDAGVVGVGLVERLQDRHGLHQRGHRLVIEDLVERQRVEHLRLHVLGVLATERTHRFFVVSGARVLVDRVVVLVELLQRSEPVALTLRLRCEGLTFFNRVEPALQRGRVKRADQRVGSLADGDAPIRDGAGGIHRGNGIERLDGFGKVERMQHGQCAVELLLGLGRAGGLEQHGAQITLRPLHHVVAVRDGHRREGDTQACRDEVFALPHVHLLHHKVEERRVAHVNDQRCAPSSLGARPHGLSDKGHPQSTCGSWCARLP